MRTAVLKANYVSKGSKGAYGRMSASADYYAHDKDLDGSYTGELEGFTKDADDLNRDEAKTWLREHYNPESEHGYRMVMSPGRAVGEDDLREWTRDGMTHLEEQRGHDIDYLAYVHNDEQHAHVHVMFAEENTLNKHDLNELRRDTTERAEDWQQSREQTESLEHSFEHSFEHQQALEQERESDQDLDNLDFQDRASGPANKDEELELELELD